MTGLTDLAIAETNVTDLSPIARIKSSKGYWEMIDISSTEVTDLSPLLSLPNLGYLYLKGAKVADDDISEIQARFPSCEIVD